MNKMLSKVFDVAESFAYIIGYIAGFMVGVAKSIYMLITKKKN